MFKFVEAFVLSMRLSGFANSVDGRWHKYDIIQSLSILGDVAV